MNPVDRWGLESLERIHAGLIDEYGRENPNGPRKKLDLFGYQLLERLRAEATAEAEAAAERLAVLGTEGEPSGADNAGPPSPVR
jgi:hypothetical protein